MKVRTRKLMTITRRPRICRIGVLASLALGCGACTTGGYGSTGGSVGAARPAVVPNSTALNGVPAAAARTLTQRALIGWRLNGAQVFGSVRAAVFGQGPFDLKRARGSETIDLSELAHQEPGTEHVIFLPGRVFLQPKGRGSPCCPAASGGCPRR